MKKWQLLKIEQSINLQKLKYTTYLDLLNFTDEQIDIIINNIDKESIPSLINFFSLLNKGKYDFSDFERLGITNIKEIIIDKLLNASDINKSIIILNWFKYKIDKFQSKEEWKIFMENLTDDISICNLSYVIDWFKEYRIEAIEKVMNNTSNLRTIYLSDVNRKENLREDNLLDLLNLVIENYDVKLSTKLIKRLVKTKQDKETYNEIINYLKNPVLFHEKLPKLFLNSEKDQLASIIETLRKVDDLELLNNYLSFDCEKENLDILNKYISRIVLEDNSVFKESMMVLLENRTIFESLINDKDKLDLVIEKIKPRDIKDEKCVIMAKLLQVIPYDIWLDISLDIENEKLEYIYQNNEIFLDIINTIDLKLVMDRIKKLSLINIKKIFVIFGLKSFKNNFKRHIDISILFDISKENLIDNIYKKYLFEEEKNKLLGNKNINRIDSSCETELLRLATVLDNGYDINLVLDNYRDDEELDSKTLIKILR